MGVSATLALLTSNADRVLAKILQALTWGHSSPRKRLWRSEVLANRNGKRVDGRVAWVSRWSLVVCWMTRVSCWSPLRHCQHGDQTVGGVARRHLGRCNA
eukprot:6471834-Amphidinium_carterae.1